MPTSRMLHHLYDDAVNLAFRAHKIGRRQIIVTNRAHGTDRQNASPRNMVRNSRLRDVVDDIYSVATIASIASHYLRY